MSRRFQAETAENLAEVSNNTGPKLYPLWQTYWNLIEAIPPTTLKLTRLDDEIYEHLQREFPEFIANPEKIKRLDEDWMKDSDGKERWRKFISEYEKRIDDYNFGSLIRTNCTDEYSQSNSIFVTRMQFYAIEIARNRLGLNDVIYNKAQAEKAKKKKTQSSS
ncbi:DUF757-domain-containing protein [Serendipita vermifera]|nr:DUF757-domain-containing protein [Serendipita vermifera]